MPFLFSWGTKYKMGDMPLFFAKNRESRNRQAAFALRRLGEYAQFRKRKLCTLDNKRKIKIQHLKNVTITIQLPAIF